MGEGDRKAIVKLSIIKRTELFGTVQINIIIIHNRTMANIMYLICAAIIVVKL